jgi:hypothetical protein
VQVLLVLSGLNNLVKADTLCVIVLSFFNNAIDVFLTLLLYSKPPYVYLPKQRKCGYVSSILGNGNYIFEMVLGMLKGLRRLLKTFLTLYNFLSLYVFVKHNPSHITSKKNYCILFLFPQGSQIVSDIPVASKLTELDSII